MEPHTGEQGIISGGLAAQALLDNPTFSSTIAALVHDCFTAFTTSTPSQSAKREETYNLYRGLQAIEAELVSRVQNMEEIVRRQDAEHEDLED
jgi:hypothetical protein